MDTNFDNDFVIKAKRQKIIKTKPNQMKQNIKNDLVDNSQCFFPEIRLCQIKLNDTHMEELVLYWIQYKNSLKYKIGCF